MMIPGERKKKKSLCDTGQKPRSSVEYQIFRERTFSTGKQNKTVFALGCFYGREYLVQDFFFPDQNIKLERPPLIKDIQLIQLHYILS